MLIHFSRDVLHRYRAHPELYQLEEDSMGGRVLAVDPALPFHEIRYALRRLVNGSTCIAVLSLDLQRLPPEERRHWVADRLSNPDFAEDDPDFEAWTARYLEGSWEVPDGRLSRL
jgi:hypothetical protein